MKNTKVKIFLLLNVEIIKMLKELIKKQGGAIKLSELKIETYKDLTCSIEAVEAVRSCRKPDLYAKKLRVRFNNRFYAGEDYEIGYVGGVSD